MTYGTSFGYPHGGRDQRECRRERARVRTEIRAGRTPAQQLAELDRRGGGPGLGSKRERARLHKVIASANRAAAVDPPFGPGADEVQTEKHERRHARSRVA